MKIPLLLSLTGALAIDPKCPIVHDGRIPSTATPATFDTSASPFNPEYVKGSAKFSEILSLSSVKPSRFDLAGGQPVMVTINDKSIFAPGGKPQNGFRRAGLLLAKNDGKDSSNQGVKTFHFSVQSGTKALNLTHEYMLVWHERDDFNGNQFEVATGTDVGKDGKDKANLRVKGKNGNVLWQTPAEKGAWQNFGITLDFEKNTMQVYYSKGVAEMKSVVGPVPNENGGMGQFQVGILKKPTGTSDVVNAGFQEKGFEENMVYGGIFIEDSANSCLSK